MIFCRFPCASLLLNKSNEPTSPDVTLSTVKGMEVREETLIKL